MTTNTQREFWVRKDPEQEWQTLKVSHPDYTDAVRIAANTFKEQTFCGGDQSAVSSCNQINLSAWLMGWVNVCK